MKKLKVNIKRIILIILLIIVLINLISTYFIVVYYLYITRHLGYLCEEFTLFSDLIYRGIPISIKSLIYVISRHINFKILVSPISILISLLFIIIIPLFYIPGFFASRIIFCLKPLFTRLSFSSAILFYLMGINELHLFNLNFEKIKYR